MLGAVIGNTDDGNTIYFAANKTLKETAGPAPNGESAVEGKCKRPKEEKEIPASATCNIYMEHFEGGKWYGSGSDAPDGMVYSSCCEVKRATVR